VRTVKAGWQAGWAVPGAGAFIVAMAVVYLSGLGTSPPYLMHDELQFSLQARSIAETGHDLAGRSFPVFFTEPEFPPGRDPVIVYVTAAVLKVMPFSAAGVKVPTALVGLLNIALMFGVGWALFGDPWRGLLAAALLAFTPIHFIRSRLVLSPFYSIPFILGWLVALSIYLRTGSRRALLSSTACITLSVYTYLACMVMAPVYFVITLAVAVRREGRQVITPMVATAVILLTPLLIWSATHPERYAQLIDAYRLYGAGSSGAPILAPGTPSGPQRWIGLMWQFLNPDFLFLSGDSSLINSTRMAGLFPIAFIALMAAGLWAAVRSTDPLTRVIVAGLVTSPLASLLSGAIEMNRIMFVIPFGALTAAIGAVALLNRGGLPRALAILLIAAVPIQFASFHRDYTVDYPVRAAKWFGGNVRDAVLEAGSGSGQVYLSERIPFIGRYWAFYANGNREAQYFADPPAAAVTGARAACRLADATCDAFRRSSEWQQVASIRELSGEEAFLIFERR
jgi:4-amino-4-deoxy-L-arabinose transferase-like glycosyltransferase